MEWRPHMEWDDYDGPLFGNQSFKCVICCQNIVSHSIYNLNDTSLPPVCKGCEMTWGNTTHLSAGSFKDRRIVNQIKALSEALQASSYRVENGVEPI